MSLQPTFPALINVYKTGYKTLSINTTVLIIYIIAHHCLRERPYNFKQFFMLSPLVILQS